MYMMTARTLAAAFAAGTFAITAGVAAGGCSEDTAPVATNADAIDPDAGQAPGEAPEERPDVGEVAEDPAVGQDTPLPAMDAVVLRDELLELAVDAPFGTGSGADFTIVQSWLDAHPALERSLFDDQEATTTMISSSSAFLIEDVTAPGDQAFAWAVLDTAGRCAGAVALIPGNPDGSVSDSGLPTVFAPVDGLDTCTARAAIDELATV